MHLIDIDPVIEWLKDSKSTVWPCEDQRDGGYLDCLESVIETLEDERKQVREVSPDLLEAIEYQVAPFSNHPEVNKENPYAYFDDKHDGRPFWFYNQDKIAEDVCEHVMAAARVTM